MLLSTAARTFTTKGGSGGGATSHPNGLTMTPQGPPPTTSASSVSFSKLHPRTARVQEQRS